jgi:hypothetical protein
MVRVDDITTQRKVDTKVAFRSVSRLRRSRPKAQSRPDTFRFTRVPYANPHSSFVIKMVVTGKSREKTRPSRYFLGRNVHPLHASSWPTPSTFSSSRCRSQDVVHTVIPGGISLHTYHERQRLHSPKDHFGSLAGTDDDLFFQLVTLGHSEFSHRGNLSLVHICANRVSAGHRFI